MTKKEKAEAYDEAKARMSRAFNSNRCTIGFMNEIFPELAESEDERIMKWLIRYFEQKSDNNVIFADISLRDIIAWLDKQGEQKPKWNEEDESKVYDIIYFLNTAKAHYANTEALDDCVDWLKSLKQRIHVSSAKPCKDDTLLDLLQKMPPFITVDGVDYYFVMKKTSFYTAYYKAIGEDGSGNAIFWATAFSPIDLLTEMLEKLKNEGLLELTL